jgi:predicted ATP-grasp superfamily ATP-dependent carboligase
MHITKQPLLVLDGHQRCALAVTRALGRRGVAVIVADHDGAGLAGSSRFCSGRAEVASFGSSVEAYRADVAFAVDRHGCRLVLPLTDGSITALHGGGADAPPIAGPSRVAYAQAADKLAASRLAREVGIAVPDGVECNGADDIAAAVRDRGFPIVIKPARSRYVADDRIQATNVSLVRDAASLDAALAQGWVGQLPCLVQQFIRGTGAGVFVLYGPAGPVAWFAHRRLREKPPAGGVSVLCESIAPDADLKRAATRLLDALRWFGPAMVEFRVDPQGKPWFMEVNGRFWGSLQLAIDCGVDFPWLFYQLCLGRSVDPVTDYAVGRRLRWELGDLDHLLLQLRGKGTVGTAAAKLRALGAFLNPVAGRTEVFRPDDPRPFFHELRVWVAGIRR